MTAFLALGGFVALTVLASACGRTESSSSGNTPEASSENASSDSGSDDVGANVCAYTVTACDGRQIRPPADGGSVPIGGKTGNDGGCWCACAASEKDDPETQSVYCTPCLCDEDSGCGRNQGGEVVPPGCH